MLVVLFLEIMNGTNDIVKVRKCPNGHPVTDDMKFCPVCGTDITNVGIRFCPNCGKERQSGDMFCTNCGLSFKQEMEKEKDDDNGFSFFGFFWID
jgi:uncharacterized membrane protein YvbJ